MDDNIQLQFEKACDEGDAHKIKELLSSHRELIDLNEGFEAACFSGTINVVQYLLSSEETIDYNRGLWSACEGGSTDIAKLLISKATNFEDCLREASLCGYPEIMKLLIPKCNRDQVYECIETSVQLKNRELVEMCFKFEYDSSYILGLSQRCEDAEIRSLLVKLLEKCNKN